MTDDTKRMTGPDETTGVPNDTVRRADDRERTSSDEMRSSNVPPEGSDVTREPRWSGEQLETADQPGGHPTPDEVRGGYRGGGGPDWNKGQMEFDDAQHRIPESEMKESEEGPWGTADQAEREEREERGSRG